MTQKMIVLSGRILKQLEKQGQIKVKKAKNQSSQSFFTMVDRFLVVPQALKFLRRKLSKVFTKMTKLWAGDVLRRRRLAKWGAGKERWGEWLFENDFAISGIWNIRECALFSGV